MAKKNQASALNLNWLLNLHTWLKVESSSITSLCSLVAFHVNIFCSQVNIPMSMKTIHKSTSDEFAS